MGRIFSQNENAGKDIFSVTDIDGAVGAFAGVGVFFRVFYLEVERRGRK